MNSKKNKPQTHTIQVSDISCEHCVARMHELIEPIDGVQQVEVSLEQKTVDVTGGDIDAIVSVIKDGGYQPEMTAAQQELPGDNKIESMQLQHYIIGVSDMSCSSCVANVEKAVRSVEGVKDVEIHLLEKEVRVTGGHQDDVAAAIISNGYEPHIIKEQEKDLERYTLLVDDMTCSSCVANVEKAILSVDGVFHASVDLLGKTADVAGGDPQSVVQAVISKGYHAALDESIKYQESYRIRFEQPISDDQQDVVKQIVDVTSIGALNDQFVEVSSKKHPADLILSLQAQGIRGMVEEIYEDPLVKQEEEEKKIIAQTIKRALIAGSVGMTIMAGHMSGSFPTIEDGRVFWLVIALLCLKTMYYSGKEYYQTAWQLARHGSANMDTLVALGTGAAWLSSVLVLLFPALLSQISTHLYFDASVMILAFLQLGHGLEARAKRKTGAAIASLISIQPKTGRVERDEGRVEIPLSFITIGDKLRVLPGESITIDGIVVEGSSTVDEAMLTGEPLAVKKSVGDGVTGGTINKSGTLLLEANRTSDETVLSQIIGMVKTAQMSKPPIGRLVDKVAAVFVPIVIGISILSFIAWKFLGPEPQLGFALTTAIAVLVIACPCSLGLATPIAIMVGMSKAAENNVLIKNSDGLQTAAGLSHIVVDKTGTLTEGNPTVTSIVTADDVGEKEVLTLAASLESDSEHPLADAVLNAHKNSAGSLLPVENFSAIQGRGVYGKINNQWVYLGNESFMQEQNVVLGSELIAQADSAAREGATPIWLAKEEQILGILILKDPIRSDSIQAVSSLQGLGMEVVMCTGDNHQTAKSVAQELGITLIHSELMPVEKLEVVKRLQKQGANVGMVGDGVNDAPALAQADTGFAIGSGTEVAIENADITLTGDSLQHVVSAVKISRAVLRNIKQNLFGAFIYNTLGIPLAAGLFFPITGWLLHPMFASAAMALSSVTVVTNANRLRFFKPTTS